MSFVGDPVVFLSLSFKATSKGTPKTTHPYLVSRCKISPKEIPMGVSSVDPGLN